MENWSKKGLLHENMQWSQLISGAWLGLWVVDPPSNYAYLKWISLSAVQGVAFLHPVIYRFENEYLNIWPSCGAEKTNAKIQARNICQKLDIFKGQLVMEMEVMFNASLHKSLKFTSPLTMMTWQIENPLKVCNFDKYVKLFLELFYFFSSFLKKLNLHVFPF